MLDFSDMKTDRYYWIILKNKDILPAAWREGYFYSLVNLTEPVILESEIIDFKLIEMPLHIKLSKLVKV